MTIPENFAIGGIWPLGTITINHGVPAAITTNVGAQSSGPFIAISPQSSVGRPFTATCRQLIFSCPSSNSADVIVNDGNFAGIDQYRTVLLVPKGKTLSLPLGALCEDSIIDVTRYYVDGTTSDVVAVSAVDASS